MPSIRKKATKDGRTFYEIRVSRGRSKAPLSSRWYPPEGWSQRAIDRALAKEAADFERRCAAGEVMSRAEMKERAELARQEDAKIQTVKQYGEAVFMPALCVRCSENTRSSYQGNLDNWIYPAVGSIKLPEVSSADLTALLLSMQKSGKAHATAVKVYTILNSLFKMAYMADAIPRNPMDKVARPKPKKDELKERGADSHTVDELRHILDCLDREPLHWRALIRLLIDTGIRRGECCGLQWSDVNFQDNTITIRGNLCYTPKKGVYLDTPKNGKTRTIDVDPAVMALLNELRAYQSNHAISRYVFSQDSSPEPMHPQTPTRYLRKFSARCGIPGLHPHKLRHSFASVAITNGADIASVSEKLGHSDKAVTLRMYTHADQESIKRASDIFRNALKDAPTDELKKA